MFHYRWITVVVLGFATFATAQLGELDYGQFSDVGLTGLVGNQGQFLQHQYNYQTTSFGGLGSGLGLSGGLFSGNIGIPSSESITQLGQAIAEGGVPSGVHGEISTPTEQPPPQGEERRVGIAERLLGAGFLNKRRR